MHPKQLLLILLAHYRVALAVFVATVAAGAIYTYLQPKQYTTSVSVVFDVKQDPIAGMLMPATPGYIATQTEIIKSDRVAQKIVKSLRLDENPTVKRQWLAVTKGKGSLSDWLVGLLQGPVRITPSPGSNIINISYTATDPTFATLVANAYAQAYIETNIELKVDPARQYALWFGEQGKVLRENLEKSQARLSAFQQQKGIVARDEQLDAEVTKLSDLTAKLTAVQSETAEFRSKQRSGGVNLPEVMQNSVITTLRSDIGRLEAKLKEAAVNLGKAHPQYQRMETEIAALKQQLEEATRQVSSGFSAARSVGADREADLKAAIVAQKKTLLEIRSDRDQLAVLQRDADAAQNAYNAVLNRYNQSSLESQATQSNISVLAPAVEPLAPSSPNVPRNIVVILALGAALAYGAAFLLEMLDRRIRSTEELAEMLQVPVLAVIQRPRKQMMLLQDIRRRLPALR